MEEQFTLDINAEIKNLATIRNFIEKSAEICGINSDSIYDLNFAVNELVTNTIIHGYKYKPGTIKIDLWQKNGSLYVRIKDDAPVFNPLSNPPPEMNLPLEFRPVGGLGIYLTKLYVDEINHSSSPEGGNEVLLVKHGDN